MGGQIQLSAGELRQLSADARTEQGKSDDVIRAIQGVVSGTEWQSAAASSFGDLWQRNRQVLNELSQDLGKWSQFCEKQAEVADRVNRPF